MTAGRATDAQLRRLVQAMRPGGDLLRFWPLEGGFSAHVTAVEIALPDGGAERVVVRRHGAIDKGHNPDIAADEYRLLGIVRDAGLAAPQPLYLDRDGEIFGEPCLVTDFIAGTTGIAPAAADHALPLMAAWLARLHAVDLWRHDLGFLPYRDDVSPRTLRHVEALSTTPFAGRVRDALARVSPLRRNAPVLLHGDFWPGNVMWRDGEIAAVLDWEDAAIGDPLADLAGCRIELLWALGEDAARRFTTLYTSLVDIDLAALPLWDLCAATGASAFMGSWGLEPETEARMRAQARDVIERALTALASTAP